MLEGHAQQGRLLFHHLQIQDGLSQPDNAFIDKDSKGFVWISSVAGLNRFDGTGVKIYSPNAIEPGSIIGENIQSNFFEDDESDIWFTTYDALNEYKRSDDCFDYYQAYDKSKLYAGYHIFHKDANQHLWLIVQDSFIFKFNILKHEFSLVINIHQQANRARVITDGKGNVKEILAFMQGHEKISHVILGSNREAEQKPYYPNNQENYNIRKILVQGDTIAWILTPNAFIRYDFRNQEEQVISFKEGSANTCEWMNDSTIAIGMAKEGLWEFNIKSHFFTNHYYQDRDNNLSLRSNSVDYINRDRDGGIWLSTKGVGVSYAYPQKNKFRTFSALHESTGKREFIPLGLFRANDSIVWCPTMLDGFFMVNAKESKPVFSPIPQLSSARFPDNLFHVVQDANGFLWTSLPGAIVVIDPLTFETQTISQNSVFYYAGIAEPNGGIIFSGSNHGLRQAKGSWEKGYTLEPMIGLADTVEQLILHVDSKARIWTMYNLQKMMVFNSDGTKPLAILPISGIGYRLIEPPGESVVWISTSTGLFRVNMNSLQIEKAYNQSNKLPPSWFSGMELDKQGRLWIAYNQGILRFDPKTEICKMYTEHDGLSRLEYKNATYQFPDGEMWFAAVGGITKFRPEEVHDIDIVAHPVISEILVNDLKPAPPLICEVSGKRNDNEIRKLTFNYLHNTVSFKVHALEYSAPAFNKVQYRMEGLDDHNLEAKSGSVIRYPNLKYGTYTFVLHAFNSDGILNPVPYEVDITIKPPFYKTVWFYIIATLFICSIAGYIIYLRFTKALELQRVRFKLYENLHDDVGSRLTAIVLTAEELENRHAFEHPKLSSISQIAKSIVGNMRRLVWAIDPENDKMNNLIQKITHDKSLMLSDEIAFQLEADEATRNMSVPGELRYQISSICNEAMNNISKYAKATKVIIQFKGMNNKIHLTIQDNGIGFKVDEKSKNATTGSGYGLTNMKRRASRVKGTLEILSTPGQGTRIEGVFPL